MQQSQTPKPLFVLLHKATALGLSDGQSPMVLVFDVQSYLANHPLLVVLDCSHSERYNNVKYQAWAATPPLFQSQIASPQ